MGERGATGVQGYLCRQVGMLRCAGTWGRSGAWARGPVLCTVGCSGARAPVPACGERPDSKDFPCSILGLQILLWHRMSVFCRPVTFQSSGCPPLTCRCGQGTSRKFGRVWGKRNMGYFRSSLERASSRKIQLCIGGFSVS